MSNFIKQWTHKEVEILTRSFRRYSIYVIILKFVLPITALAMAVALFLYPAMTGNGKKIVLVAQETKTAPKTSPIMSKPKFIGTDSQNQPYQISAKQAIQEKVNLLTLEEINADITLNNGDWISAVAGSGNYDSIQHQVNLFDEVNLYLVEPTGNTYQAYTKNAFIDADKGILQSNDPVTIKSDAVELDAQSFIVEREKKKITFKGPVRLVILKR